VFVLDAILWLTPRGEIAIPIRLISHAHRAMSITVATVPILVADEFREAISIPAIRSFEGKGVTAEEW
jgi:hypothetical protein